MRRNQVRTPALVLDLDALDTNIALMAKHSKKFQVGLRPHAKSHKSPEIARRLICAGALGASCATIGEAEGLAAAGTTGILITSPMSTDGMLIRLNKLLLRQADIMLVTDDVDNVRNLAVVSAKCSRVLPTIVELDVGQRRTGCLDIGDAVALAREIASHRSLRFAGIQAYWGHLQQVTPFKERENQVANGIILVKALVAALAEVSLKPEIVTGSGTGTHWLDVQHNVFTELQPGSYLFLDSCYQPLQLTPSGNPFSVSLFVAAGVVNTNKKGRAIIDAGLKAFATDSGKPIPVRGVGQEAVYRFMGDEHGAVDVDPTSTLPPLGSTIELLTSHCDPTVNLHASYIVVSGEDVVDEWPIVARGYSGPYHD